MAFLHKHRVPAVWNPGRIAVAPQLELDWTHPLARGLLAYWAPNRSGLLRSFVPGIADIAPINLGQVGVFAGYLAGGASSFSTYGTTPYNAAWAPTTTVSVVAGVAVSLSNAGNGAGNNTYIFRTEQSSNGWGCYNTTVPPAHLYMRIGSAWADVGLALPLDGLAHQFAMTYDGATFTGNIDGTVGTVAATGAIVQSPLPLTLGDAAASCRYFAIYNRAVPADQLKMLQLDPYGMLRPANVRPLRLGVPTALRRPVMFVTG
jgi:hypothetical protein